MGKKQIIDFQLFDDLGEKRNTTIIKYVNNNNIGIIMITTKFELECPTLTPVPTSFSTISSINILSLFFCCSIIKYTVLFICMYIYYLFIIFSLLLATTFILFIFLHTPIILSFLFFPSLSSLLFFFYY